MNDEIHGITGAPYSTPSVRKKLPAPHSRNRIDLDGGSRVKRSWQDTSVLDLSNGDMVSDFGLVVEDPEEIMQIPTVDQMSGEVPGRPVWLIRLTNLLGVTRDYPGHERVYAFVKEKQP